MAEQAGPAAAHSGDHDYVYGGPRGATGTIHFVSDDHARLLGYPVEGNR
jgi:hypothetical protein